MTTLERFWAKVEKSDGCWEWNGLRDRQEYGRFYVSPARSSARAHRVSWELHVGPIPAGLFVLHSCDNPPCVRPDHLFLGTQANNMADMKAKGRLVIDAEAFRLGRLPQAFQRGEANPRAKLTDEAVRAIRSSDRTARELAAEYGVSRYAVVDVRRRRNRKWPHVV